MAAGGGGDEGSTEEGARGAKAEQRATRSARVTVPPTTRRVRVL